MQNNDDIGFSILKEGIDAALGVNLLEDSVEREKSLNSSESKDPSATIQQSTLAYEANTNAINANNNAISQRATAQQLLNRAVEESYKRSLSGTEGDFTNIGRGYSLGGTLPGYKSVKNSNGDLSGIILESDAERFSELVAKRAAIGDKELYSKSELPVVEAFNKAIKDMTDNMVLFNEKVMDRMVGAQSKISQIQLGEIVDRPPESLEQLLYPVLGRKQLERISGKSFNTSVRYNGSYSGVPEYQAVASQFQNDALQRIDALPMGDYNKNSLKDTVIEMFQKDITENIKVTGDEVYDTVQRTVDTVDRIIARAADEWINTNGLVQQRLKEMDARDRASEMARNINRHEQENALSVRFAGAPRIGVENQRALEERNKELQEAEAERLRQTEELNRQIQIREARRVEQIENDIDKTLNEEERKAEQERERQLKLNNYAMLAGGNYKFDNRQILIANELLNKFSSFKGFFDSLDNGPLGNTISGKRRSDAFYNEYRNIFGSDNITNEGTVTHAEGLIDEILNLRSKFMNQDSIAQNFGNSEEERNAAMEKAGEIAEEYRLKLEELIKATREAIDTSEQDIKQQKLEERNIRESEGFNNDQISGRKNYDYWKYAWRRNPEQQREFELAMPANFSTTGNFRDSLAKTLFNKSVGYRQRQGLVGFSANLGYNASGVGLSLLLGSFATGLKKAGEAVLRFCKASVEAYGQIEVVKTNLGIVYGSQSEANTAFNEIAQYATKSPFGVETVSRFAVQLKQSGVYASDLMDTLKQIGDVAGGNQQKFGNIANAFSQIEANGKATTRQLREFATAGIPIYAQLSKQLGKSVEQIRQMTAQGKISASIIEEAFSQLTGEGGMFHNAVNIGAKTWAARRQNLADARQLAQAQLGQWAINLGGTSSTDNDSIAKSFLNILEDIYSGVENFFLLKNIAKDVSAIERRDDDTRQLETAIAYASATGDKNLKELLSKQLEQKLITRNYSQERASNAQSVALYMDAKENADIVKESINQYIGEAEKINNNKFSMEEKEYLLLSGNIRLTLSELNDEFSKFKKQMSKTYKFFTDETKLSDYYISQVEAYTQKGFDVLSTYATKGSGALSEVGTPNSLYKMYQDSIEKAKQTPAGKIRIEQQQEREWEEMRKQYDMLSPYLDKTATLTEENVVSLTKLSEILKSGIINPLEKFDLTPERMSNNKYKAKSVGRTIEQNEADWKEFSKKIDSLRNIDLRGLSDKDIGNLQNVFAKMFGGNASDFTFSTRADGTKTFDKVSNFEEEVKNTEKNVKAFNTVFALFIKSLAKDNEEVAKTVEAYLSSKGELAAKADDWKTLNPKVDPYPLWQRILSNSLGVDLNLFKNTGNGKGYITNGNQAMDIFQSQAQRNTIKNVMTAMLSTASFRDVFGKIATGNREGIVSNNSKDGTLQINWKQTYKNISDFSLSLNAAAKVTRAYSDSLMEQENALTEFITSSITQTEDAANIWDENYQKVLGEYAKNIKAVDANAYDLLFDETADGFIKMRENAPAAATLLLEFTQNLRKTTQTMASFKDVVEESGRTINNNRIKGGLTYLYGGDSAFEGVNKEDSDKIIESWYQKLTAESGNSESVLFGLDKDKLMEIIKSSIKDGKVDLDFMKKVINLEAENSLRDKYKEASKAYTGSYIKDEEYKRLADAERQAYENYRNSNGDESAKTLYEQAKKATEEYKNNNLASKADKELRGRELRIEQENNNNLNSLNEAITRLAEELSEVFGETKGQVASERYATNADIITKFLASQHSFNSPWLEGPKDERNTYSQQRAMNALEQKGSWADFVKGAAFTDGKLDETFKNSIIKSAENAKLDISKELGVLNNSSSSTQEIEGAISSILEKTTRWQNSMNNIKSTFEDLGKTAKDTMLTDILNGYNQTTQKIGANIFKMNENLMTSKESGKALATVWKNIGVEMLNSLGPAMTQAGLSLITSSGGNKGQIAAGVALVAAGGVTNVLSGYLGASKDVDKDKEEEQRLQNLRDLLKEIIDQAKTDAQYYENNMRHQNALSMQREIKVNDAIITPNGNVVSTHPDDYLIATKTPGALINNNGNRGDVKVNFTVIDQSTGGKVQVNDVKQNQNSDGSIDIQAMVVAVTAQAIADGTMDDAFDSRSIRLRGRSFAG